MRSLNYMPCYINRGVAQPGLARTVRVREVGGSNPLAPTIFKFQVPIYKYQTNSPKRGPSDKSPKKPNSNFLFVVL